MTTNMKNVISQTQSSTVTIILSVFTQHVTVIFQGQICNLISAQ